jgi:hypothetical protein
MRLVFLICLSSLLFACSSKKNQVQPVIPVVALEDVKEIVTDTLLYYSRGACYGMCPIFELTVMKDGKAFYLGKNHVDRIGGFQAKIEYTDLAPVLQKANDIGYFELKGVYDNEGVQDLPNIVTAIANNGKLHRVRNRYKGPAALRMLYAELDTMIARQTWSPTAANK